jgi:hypothetical protein
MAISSLSAISSALSLYFAPKIAKQTNRAARTLSLLDAVPVSGKSINYDASLGVQTASPYVEGADVVAGEYLIDAKVPAITPWSLYRNAFGLTEHQLEVALGSAGSALELINLLEESVFESNASLASKINQDLFTGTGGLVNTATGAARQIHGVLAPDGVKAATGSFNGIDRDVYTDYQGNSIAVGGALTVSALNHGERVIFSRSGLKPDFLVASPAVVDVYRGIFEQQRAISPEVVSAYGGSVDADRLTYAGLPIVRDKDCPDGYVIYFNKSAMQVAYLPVEANGFGDSLGWSVRMASGSNGEDAETPSGIPIRTQALAKTGDSVKFFNRTTIGIKYRRPNAIAVLTGITV